MKNGKQWTKKLNYSATRATPRDLFRSPGDPVRPPFVPLSNKDPARPRATYRDLPRLLCKPWGTCWAVVGLFQAIWGSWTSFYTQYCAAGPATRIIVPPNVEILVLLATFRTIFALFWALFMVARSGVRSQFCVGFFIVFWVGYIFVFFVFLWPRPLPRRARQRRPQG